MLSSLLRIFGAYRVYEKVLRNQISEGESPEHIGIILDGNRRWADLHNLPRFAGHSFGARTAESLLDWCRDLKIKTLTLYVLSTENLARPEDEVSALMQIIEEKLRALLNDERIHRYKIRVKALGRLDLLPNSIRKILSEIEVATEIYDQHFLNIAIAYGGRLEIVDVVKKIAEKVVIGHLNFGEIDEKTVEQHLYTSHLPNPEPDLIIRTSGEERLSGFLLYQSAYSELVFTDVYWPDFRKIDLMRAIRTYQKRVRRFGR